MFQFEVHLPYFVWRRKENHDHRRDANGSPLRKTQNVSFLNWKNPDRSGFLYEAQISCVVSGRDQYRWLAYCFVDNYFDAGEEERESVLSYHENSLGEGGTLMDPLTYGSSTEDKPIEMRIFSSGPSGSSRTSSTRMAASSCEGGAKHPRI
jgi:hypothetical protein